MPCSLGLHKGTKVARNGLLLLIRYQFQSLVPKKALINSQKIQQNGDQNGKWDKQENSCAERRYVHLIINACLYLYI